MSTPATYNRRVADHLALRTREAGQRIALPKNQQLHGLSFWVFCRHELANLLNFRFNPRTA